MYGGGGSNDKGERGEGGDGMRWRGANNVYHITGQTFPPPPIYTCQSPLLPPSLLVYPPRSLYISPGHLVWTIRSVAVCVSMYRNCYSLPLLSFFITVQALLLATFIATILSLPFIIVQLLS